MRASHGATARLMRHRYPRRRAMTQRRSILVAGLAATLAAGAIVRVAGDEHGPRDVVRAAVPAGAIRHVMVIDLENEDFATTFGASSPAVYLNTTLLSQGQLVTNYFATSHVSLGNYIAQVSGQGPTVAINNDCLNLASLSQILRSWAASRTSCRGPMRRTSRRFPDK